MKATAIAPSNIAFIKYWGKKDEVLRLPANGSISVNQSNLFTTTTVEFSPAYNEDIVIIDGKQDKEESARVIRHLNRIRTLAKISHKARVVSKNSFPTAGGLASSASGFAALTVAGAKAAGLKLSEKELSILARQGSGSACRSIPDGFVEWLDGETSETSYAVSLFPAEHWDLSIIAVLFGHEQKDILTTEGMNVASTSPFYKTRQSHMKQKILVIKKAMEQKNFKAFGEIIESEAMELHVIMLTSKPSLMYWAPQTIHTMKLVRKWRTEGLPSYFTIDAGPHLHLICEKKNEKKLINKLKDVKETYDVIVNYPSIGARLTQKHLF